MMDLLSKDHLILEKGMMEYRPFGVDLHGKQIRDATGVKVRAFVDYLEDIMLRAHGGDAGERAVQQLCRLLNERIPDRTYHINAKFLKNVWNSYSYEFVCFLVEFCKEISGDPLFAAHAGEEKFLSAVIQTLGRPFSVPQIYKMFPHFGEKFSSLILKVGMVTDRSAVLSMAFTDSVYRQFGPYRKACATLVCQSAKGALLAVPEKIHHLKRAAITDLKCVVNGDDCCEWELRWEPQQRTGAMWKVMGMVIAVLVFMYLRVRHPELPLLEALLLAVPPAAAIWLANRLQLLMARMKVRDDLIQEQLHSVEAQA
jgi:hypothetical protein